MFGVLITITTLSTVVAVVSATAAWRLARENRRRSEARVAYLADVLHEHETPDAAPVAVPHLLEPTPPRAGTPALPLAIAGAGVLVVALAAGLPARPAGDAPAGAAPTTVGGRGTAPATLDLVALTHERGAGGRLELRGEVETPGIGAKMEDMTAVALLFDQQGAYVSSTRSPLMPLAEPTGTRASFFISIPDAGRVGRYRVSFRDGERVVPHIDRRRSARVEAGS